MADMQHGADVNLVDDAGWAPLHGAANDGSISAVSLLIDHGADVSGPVLETLQTPLHLAASEGHLSVVQALLAAGADATMKDVDGNTAQDLAKSNGHSDLSRVLAAAVRV